MDSLVFQTRDKCQFHPFRDSSLRGETQDFAYASVPTGGQSLRALAAPQSHAEREGGLKATPSHTVKGFHSSIRK